MKSLRLAWLPVLALLAAGPLIFGQYHLTLLVPVFAYSIALLGLNLLFGYSGLVSLGHALFLSVGAYSAGALGTKFGILGFEIQLLAAVGTSVLLAVPLGLLCVRYSKIYFGMLTLAFSMIFHSFLFKFYSITGGESGIAVQRPTIMGMAFEGMDKVAFLTGPFYYLCLGLLVIVALLLYRLVQSPFGLAIRAGRDNASKATFLGIDVRRGQFYVFLISAACSGAGGAIIGVSVGLADPEMAYWTQSGNMIFMIILGGFRDFVGPILGVAVFVFLQDWLMSVTPYWRFALGTLLACIVIFAPMGLVGIIKKLSRSASPGAGSERGRVFAANLSEDQLQEGKS